MRTTKHPTAALVLVAFALNVPAAIQGDDETPSQLLERLRDEERAREEARAADETREEAARSERERAAEEQRDREASAEREAARRFAVRRDAMREWHASFAAMIQPVLDAREQLYQRLPRRMFAAARPACVAFASAVEEAAPRYRPAPERRIDLLARDLLAVYRDSARHCVEGGYFSFTVREGQVRQIVGELIVALEPYDLAFPAAAPSNHHRRSASQ